MGAGQAFLIEYNNMKRFLVSKGFAPGLLFSITLSALIFFEVSCSQQKVENEERFVLTAQEFSEKLKAQPTAKVVDVRTPEEYSEGHLPGALNINWNSGQFKQEILRLDTASAIFVYCLSGGRSASAAETMRSMGFSKVYELDGGIMKWRSAGLPQEQVSKNAIKRINLDSLLTSDKLVLLDFYAEWCVPCKKMEPFLNEIKREQADKVEVIRIDVEQQQEFAQEMGIDEIPVLILYKNKKLLWKQVGYVEKVDIVGQLKQ